MIRSNIIYVYIQRKGNKPNHRLGLLFQSYKNQTAIWQSYFKFVKDPERQKKDH